VSSCASSAGLTNGTRGVASSTVIFILPSAVIGGFLLGRWAERKLDSFPWVTVSLVLGAGGSRAVS
jgi:hypothetical protein